jgi:hypothetical protein
MMPSPPRPDVFLFILRRAVRDCYRDFQELAEKIVEVAEVTKSGNLSPDVPVKTTLLKS